MPSTHDPDNALPEAHTGTSETVRALGYLIDPGQGAGVAWDEGVLARAAEQAGWEYVRTVPSAPTDADPIADLITAISADRVGVVIVPGLFHLHGEVPRELLAHARVCDASSCVVYSFGGPITHIPPLYHHLDTDRPVEPQRGQRRPAALRVWEQEDRSPQR
ncbi:hypothetical protein ACFC06_25105 [Nocardia sp. NPDC056064]|uniref:hypothetical protein n=1 Tax=Nocardia sp. NPDC056064 TaxID=3345701 RepID=UPI0035DFADEB